MRYELIIIGGSAGSLDKIMRALSQLPDPFLTALIIVLHRKNNVESTLIDLLRARTSLPVKEADDKEEIIAGHIYIAPADYHLLIEKDKTLALDYSEKINFSRPAIDITFQTAAETYGMALATILLSGSNADGVNGLKHVKKYGGLTAVQSPETCEMPYMPQQALLNAEIDMIIDGNKLANFIFDLNKAEN